MKKTIKIGIISLSAIIVIVFTSLFFLLDITFLFVGNSDGNLSSNYEVEGKVTISGKTAQVDLQVDENKVKAEIGPLEFYVESIGNRKYIYTKGLFGKWIKASLTKEDDQTAFVDLIGDIERDDFVFKSIGYYEMTPEKLEEEGLQAMSIRFRLDGILMEFKYNDNISYSILLKDFGKAEVDIPK